MVASQRRNPTKDRASASYYQLSLLANLVKRGGTVGIRVVWQAAKCRTEELVDGLVAVVQNGRLSARHSKEASEWARDIF